MLTVGSFFWLTPIGPNGTIGTLNNTERQRMNKIVIFAGAGISEESGLSTFRCQDGLWENYDVSKICDLPQFFEDRMAGNQQARQDVFDFYNMRKLNIQNAKPNLAHLKIAEWQQTFGADRVQIVTSNIDDLFEKAGCVNVVHVHGDTNSMKCLECDEEWHIGDDPFDSQESCPGCGSDFTKPNVVFFGENAPEYVTMGSIYQSGNRNAGDLFFYVGSSMNVIHPLRLFRGETKETRILVDINAHQLAGCGVRFDVVLQGTATESFSRINLTLKNDKIVGEILK